MDINSVKTWKIIIPHKVIIIKSNFNIPMLNKINKQTNVNPINISNKKQLINNKKDITTKYDNKAKIRING